MSLQLTFEAHDVWFFRTSRPFGAALVASGDGELLPPPSVVFGALRAGLGDFNQVIWTDYRSNWRQYAWLGPPTLPANGGPWPPDAVRLRGCLPVKLEEGAPEEVLFPTPEFVWVAEEAGPRPKARELRYCRPCGLDSHASFSGGDLEPVMPPREADGSAFIGEHRTFWLPATNFVEILRGSSVQTSFQPVLPDDLARAEPRIGIARDTRTRTVRSGLLYGLTTYRWNARVPYDSRESFGIAALVEALSPDKLPLAGRFSVKFGGEQRLAWARWADPGNGWLTSEQEQEIGQAIAKADGWFMTLATPAAFTHGWRPGWVQEDGRAERSDGQGVTVPVGRLVGLLAGAPYVQSGWDLSAGSFGRPKPIRRYMPVGATWFFEWPDDPDARPAALATVLDLQGTCISEIDPHAGYGLAFVGAWNRP